MVLTTAAGEVVLKVEKDVDAASERRILAKPLKVRVRNHFGRCELSNSAGFTVSGQLCIDRYRRTTVAGE